MNNNSENENYRYVVFIGNEDDGYYEVYYIMMTNLTIE